MLGSLCVMMWAQHNVIGCLCLAICLSQVEMLCNKHKHEEAVVLGY